MNFFHHKDLGNHLLQLCPKVVKHPVYVPKSVVCKLVDNMPVKLSQIYVETEERKFRHKTVSSSDDLSKFLKTLRYENYVEYL